MKTELDSAWESAIHNAELARKAEAEVERLRAELALAIDDCRAAQVERDNVRAAYITQIDRLRAELAKANALLLTYGWHRDECAFLEVCDDCDCGFEAILRKALTINKAARKGEGEE